MKLSIKKIITMLCGCALLFALVGCSSSQSGTNSSVNLDTTVSKDGVSFNISSDWDNDLDSAFGGITPASNNKITVDTYTNGETESLDSEGLQSGLLGSASDYTEERSWTIEGDTKITYYTDHSSENHVYSVVLGYNEETKAGFRIFLNRGTPDDLGELTDETCNALLDSIAFDPSQAVPHESSSSTTSASDSSTTSTNSSTTTVTKSQANALATANSYLRHTYFSYEGLIDQLEYEGYPEEDAIYAVDNCGANWNEQALGQAKQYLSHSAFSYSGLIDQLEYEGFTKEQATYGVDNCNADWNEQAAKQAESYLSHSSFSRSSLIDQLEYEGFTHEQAVYGVDSVGL